MNTYIDVDVVVSIVESTIGTLLFQAEEGRRRGGDFSEVRCER